MGVPLQKIFAVLLLLPAFAAQAQVTYLPLGSEEQYLLDRMETRSGTLSDSLFLGSQPVSRREAVDFLSGQKADGYQMRWSNVDHFNINRALSISSEWAPATAADYTNKANGFYKNPANLLQSDKRDFFIAANPVLSFQAAFAPEEERRFLLHTTQGAEVRGRIMDKVGFYASLTHNYEEPPAFTRDYINEWEAIPGAGKYHRSGNGYTYFQPTFNVDIPLVANHINLTLGYDKHFIGDGYRSLFLSDFAANAAFVRIRTRIWKLNYQNLYLKLEPQWFAGEPRGIGQKYATIHHLSMNVSHWLNVGVYESVTFSRDGHFEFGYMNPIIFYRAIERSMGSPDKVSIGLNAKALLAKRFNLYTQILINEFSSKRLFDGSGYWANKWGIQLGAKYFDAFSLSNLDIMAEMNIVRPYTYQHTFRTEGISLANFSHYNQPLAHPLGAGFAEFIGRVRYQPLPRLTLDGKVIYYMQGRDTAGTNFGSNIFRSYSTRYRSEGVGLIHGPESKCLLAGLQISYECWPRLFLDVGADYRNKQTAAAILPEENSLYIYTGVRLNIARRDYLRY